MVDYKLTKACILKPRAFACVSNIVQNMSLDPELGLFPGNKKSGVWDSHLGLPITKASQSYSNLCSTKTADCGRFTRLARPTLSMETSFLDSTEDTDTGCIVLASAGCNQHMEGGFAKPLLAMV